MTSDTGIQLPVGAADRDVAAGRAEDHRQEAVIEGVPVRIATRGIGQGRAVQVALRLDGVENVLGNLRWILVLVSLAGVAVAAGLGRSVASITLRPVSSLMIATERVAGTRDLRERIAEPGSDELGRLAHSFNRMLEALETSERVRHQLVADASHELRTPLSSLRTNIEVLARGHSLSPDERDRLLTALIGQMERLSRLVADVIDLARSNEPGAEVLAEVDLDELTTGCVSVARDHYPAVQFDLRSESSVVLGDAARIRRALDNLLDNAGKWSQSGGTVEVGVKAGVVSVRDHGPGIASEDAPHVFDRFWRAPGARRTPGSGLGLAIAQQVARARGGDVTLELPAGGGCVFRLVLPESP